MYVASIFGYNEYIEINAFITGAFAIGVISGAYSTEVFRGAIQSIDKGQFEACYALGLNKYIYFIKVIAPQMLRLALPNLSNVWQITLKDTSLISVTGLVEIMRQSYIAAGSTRDPLFFYSFAALLYLLLTFFSMKILNKLEKNYNKGFLMDFNLMIDSLPKLLNATLTTLKLLSLSIIFGLIIGLIFAIMRINNNIILSNFSYSFSYVFRGTPLLVQIFIIYFGLGQIEYLRSTFLWAVLKEPYWCAIIAFSLNTGAYTSEIFRSAFQTIKPGLIEAGKSLGISNLAIFYKIQLPLAVRQSLPAYGNEIILMLKGTSLASTVTLMDLTGVAKYIISTTFKPVEVFIVAGSIYLFLTFLIHNFIKFTEKKMGVN